MTNNKKDKYNLKEIEERWKKYWEEKQIYKFDSNSTKPLYVVDTPPPYVSADHLHAGHIMSYSQAEFVVRFKRMCGFNVYYPMGFDDNGLPTERFVEKKYKVDKSKITRSKFIKLCLKETKEGSKTYKKLWNDLGISVDWSKTYSTIDPVATRLSQWSLIDLYKKGALYRSENPIMWCTSCQTALAQADLEDQETKSKMNYINFKTTDGENLTIATTRPELLPACVALYTSPKDLRYKNLVGKEAIVPLFKHKIPIKESCAVDPEKGTGLMMVCTWGDQEDLEKWRVDKLSTRVLFTKDGKLNELGKTYCGLTVLRARDKIIKSLKEEGNFLKEEKIVHTLNVHERCGTPIEFFPSKQWFIKTTDLKKTWLTYGKKLNWYPKNRKKDYDLWVKSLKWDWCISRQRYYGVPLPVWYCSGCEEPVFAKIKDLPVNPIEDKPPFKKCPKCKGGEFFPEKDVMDTWTTSSLTPLIIKELIKKEKIKSEIFPATLRPNAFEIIRTWDFYTIVKSHYHFGKLPFRDVMISGHGLDEGGKKLGKRWGNYIPSNQLVEEYGADPIRYWATGAKLGQNLRFSFDEIKKGKKTVIKLLNVARFLEMNLEEYVLGKCKLRYEYVDIWILNEFNKALGMSTTAFKNYNYSKVRDAIDGFFWSRFTDYYIELVKYRLRGENETSANTAKYVLFTIFKEIIKIYAPILPFITEELYQNIYRKTEKLESIHLSDWPIKIVHRSSLDVMDFDQVIQAINEIRGYKSENGMSLGTRLEKYKLKEKVNLKKYGELIQNATRIKEIW